MIPLLTICMLRLSCTMLAVPMTSSACASLNPFWRHQWWNGNDVMLGERCGTTRRKRSDVVRGVLQLHDGNSTNAFRTRGDVRILQSFRPGWRRIHQVSLKFTASVVKVSQDMQTRPVANPTL